MILAKSPGAASRIQDEIMGNRTKKVCVYVLCFDIEADAKSTLGQTYLARVKGMFPHGLDKLRQLPADDLVWDHSEIRESAWGQGSEKADRKRSRSPPSPRSGKESASAAAFSELCPEVYEHPEVGFGPTQDGGIILRCAVGVVSHRDGVHSNNPVDGKPAYTEFRSLGYCAADDTSLVECQPLTGRTHQIRLHLQLLGNPIANDPCYGGKC